jgi:hypothetical protein
MIRSPFITELPDDAVVGKDLYMGPNMTKLPDNLHVKGDLRASSVQNFQFPKGLTVDRNLFVWYKAPMPPSDLQVGGKIWGYTVTKEEARLAAPHLKDKIG